MRALPALALAALLPCAAGAQSPPQSLDGIAPNAAVSELFARYGTPDVDTTDVGQIWTWNLDDGTTLRVTTDDDGGTLIVDVAAKNGARVPLSLGASVVSLAFGAPPAENAVGISEQNAIAGNLPGSGQPAQYWEYALAGDRELVLAYGGANGPLREAILGDRSALGRAGFLPGAPPNAYKAPVLIDLGSADYSDPQQGTAFTRIQVAADGSVTDAAIFRSSGNARLDEIALVIAKGCSFEPATRDGAAVASVYFRREDFNLAK